MVYRLKADHFLLVVNAANLFKDYAWIAEHIASVGDAVAVDASSRYALLAVQGPAALRAVQPLTGVDLSSLPHFSFAHGEVANVRATISRTGYTGEDGFEIFVPPQSADRVWQAVLAAGEADGARPVRPRRPRHAPPRSRHAPLRQRHRRDRRRPSRPAWAGSSAGRSRTSSARPRCARRRRPACRGSSSASSWSIRESPGTDTTSSPSGAKVGVVTSGTQTPFLKKAIGLAYVPAGKAAPGTGIEIDIRGRTARARVVPLPFYKRTTEPGGHR